MQKLKINIYKKRKMVLSGASNTNIKKLLSKMKMMEKVNGVLSKNRASWYDKIKNQLNNSIKRKSQKSYYQRSKRKKLMDAILESGYFNTSIKNGVIYIDVSKRKRWNPLNSDDSSKYLNWDKMNCIIDDMGGPEAAINGYSEVLNMKAEGYDIDINDYLFEMWGIKLK